ncbi:MFS transporter [Actinokineospora sp. NPDC004072]
MTGARAAGLRESARELAAAGGGRLLAATLAQSVGQGTAMACTAVYFVSVVGIAPAELGFTYSAGTLVAMGFAVLVGWLADRWGARGVAVWMSWGAAVAVAAYTVVFDLLAFVVVQVLVTSFRMGKRIGENALIGAMTGGRARFRAVQRSTLNIGISVGTLVAAVPLQVGTRGAYVAALLFTAATLAVSALLVRGVPDSPRPPRTAKAWRALRDRRYLAVGLLVGLLEIRDSVLVIAVPLWLAASTDAPRAMVAVLLFINTAMVIALQVWSARGADELPGAAAAVRRGGLALGAACAVVGAAGSASGWVTVAVLVAAVACFTIGEMWAAAGGWTLSYDLADPRAPGQYQGVFQTTTGIGLLLGPIVATTAALSFGAWGWLAIGVGFGATGVITRRVALGSEKGT